MNDTLAFILKRFNLDATADYSQKAEPINLTHFGRDDLAVLFAELEFKRVAEIGVESGKYSEVLCRANPTATLFCVDAWTPYRSYRDHVGTEKLEQFYQQTKERLEDFDAELIREFSQDAAKRFPDGSLDAVYIDCNHKFEFVVADIAAWLPKIRKHGLISGHDFLRPKNNDACNFGVIEAVTGWTSAYRVAPWFLCKGDNTPSFFWVKQ